jgi:hypothetical protein
MGSQNPYPQFIIDEASEVHVPNPNWQAWEEGYKASEEDKADEVFKRAVLNNMTPLTWKDKRLAEENANLRIAPVKAQVHALEETRPVDGKVPGRLYIELVRRDGKLRLELVKYERGIPT